MKEATLQNRCAAWLKRRGAFCEVRSPSPFTASGVADIVGCYRGFMFAIEWKAPKKLHTITQSQQRYLQRVRDAEGFAFVVDDWDVFLRLWGSVEREITNRLRSNPTCIGVPDTNHLTTPPS